MLLQHQWLKRKLKPLYFQGISYGLHWALAGRGIIVKDKAFYNLKPSELQQKGATSSGRIAVSSIFHSGSSENCSLVTSHISSISNVFVQDGAVGSSSKCDAKVRVISDNPSALLSFSNILWKIPTRAVSHDSCPLTVYVASSISPKTAEIIGLSSKANAGFLSADIEHSSLILCGKAFSDTNNVKTTLAALADPVVSARGGLPLSARLLVSGDSVILLFAPEDIIKGCSDQLVSPDAGVLLSSHGVEPMFQTGDSSLPSLFKLPSAVIVATADREIEVLKILAEAYGVGDCMLITCSLPSASKLLPGQAAYHFLAGYQKGKFVPAYINGPSALDPLELAKFLLSKLEDHEIPAFLINVGEGEKQLAGEEFVKLVQSTLLNGAPSLEPKDNKLRGKYQSFISGKFHDLPEEFTF
ncbi:hypothetical protein Sjap_004203 [Stephania japonica]|uniref:phosphoenolpyruvate carboxykinase (ATP) n=1 Tax=Stephania japonica TaxID=461633 RepID=A0AAP0K431_9MAGN